LEQGEVRSIRTSLTYRRHGMSNSQARLLAVLACAVALTAGCAASTEPRSGAGTQTEQERERVNQPDGMRGSGGGGY
jgi:hypothetical protein